MRQGHDNGIICSDGGDVIALNLGADHVSEHEWGIAGIKRAFGITDDGFGLDRRRVRNVIPLLQIATGHFAQRLGNAAWSGLWLPGGHHDGPPRPYFHKDGPTLWTAWDEKTLGAFSSHEGEQKKIRVVYEAVKSLDACVWLGGGGVFQNAGLVIGIISRMKTSTFEEWDKVDRERAQLKIDADATGVEKRLRDAGRQFYALSPRRAADGSVVFWLNPCGQDVYNSGWFNVSDLDAWIAGKGPIPKLKQQPERELDK
jgi:hypothetical protein